VNFPSKFHFAPPARSNKRSYSHFNLPEGDISQKKMFPLGRTITAATITSHLVRCPQSVISTPYIVPGVSLPGRRTYLNARYSTLTAAQRPTWTPPSPLFAPRSLGDRHLLQRAIDTYLGHIVGSDSLRFSVLSFSARGDRTSSAYRRCVLKHIRTKSCPDTHTIVAKVSLE
jgi:hypothetical protein